MKWHALSNFDSSAMAELWNRSFEDYIVPINMSEEDFLNRIDTLNLSQNNSLVADIDNEHAGMILYGEEQFKNKKTAWIGGMGVIKSMRKHGIGKEMLKKTIEMATKDQIENLHLEVIVGNDKAEKLYRKVGFQVMNTLGVGAIELSADLKKHPDLTLKSTEIEERHLALEAGGTPWQNRLNRKYQLYAILLKQREIGYFYWIEEAYALKQIILEEDDFSVVEGVLANLYERFGQVKLTVGNYDIDEKTYSSLLNLGMEERLKQLHMIKKL